MNSCKRQRPYMNFVDTSSTEAATEMQLCITYVILHYIFVPDDIISWDNIYSAVLLFRYKYHKCKKKEFIKW